MALPYSIDFLKSMEEGVFVVNRDRQILVWNARAEKLTGIESQRLIGKSCAKHLKCHVDANGNPLCDDDCPLKKALLSGKPLESELYMRHANGEVLPVKVKVIPYHNNQGFIEGAIEIFHPVDTPNWLYSNAAIGERITFTDPETGLYNRNFLDSYYLRLVKEQRSHYDRGLILIDLHVLGEIRNLKSRIDAFTLLQKVAGLLTEVADTDGETISARWSQESFVVLINNSHPVHLQDTVIQLENKLREVLYGERMASFDVAFRLMHTLIASDEPLEKVVDILHKRSRGAIPKTRASGQ